MGYIEKAFVLRQNCRRLVLGLICPRLVVTEDARQALNKVLQEHWAPQPIEVYELILEQWSKKIDNDIETAAAENQFIVFINAEYDVDWATEKNLSPGAAKSVSRAELIGARRCKHLPKEQLLELKRLVGQAIVSGIREDSEGSFNLSKTAEDFLKDRTVERSRYWTLIDAHVLTLIFSIIIFLLFHFKEVWSFRFIFDKVTYWSAIQGGVLGAYLSIIQKAGQGNWDAAAGHPLHILEVLTKLFTGGLLGGVALVIARSIHAPPMLRELVSDNYSTFVLGFSAGFMERWIPKIISTYSQAQNEHKP